MACSVAAVCVAASFHRRGSRCMRARCLTPGVLFSSSCNQSRCSACGVLRGELPWNFA